MQRLIKAGPLFIFLIVLGAGFYSAFNLNIQENLSNSIPSDSSFESLRTVLKQGERTLLLSLDIKAMDGDLDLIDQAGAELTESLEERFHDQLSELTYRTDGDPLTVQAFILEHPFLFLEAEDYRELEHLLSPEKVEQSLLEHRNTLAGLQGVGTARLRSQDPLGISSIAFRRLSRGNSFEGMMDTEGLLISNDQSRLLIQTRLEFDPQDIQLAGAFQDALDSFVVEWNSTSDHPRLDYFGPFAIIQANAAQIKKDILLTVTLSLTFILGILYFYYRRLATIGFFVLPGIFGIAAALTLIYLFKGGLSALALSASAIIMGIVVDYSFHFFSHLSQDKDPIKTRNHIAFPLAVSSITTVIGFFALTLASSSILRDFGLFTGLSLLFTLLFILLLFPHLIRLPQSGTRYYESSKLDSLVQRMDRTGKTPSKWAVLLILIATVFLTMQAGDVQFEEDMGKLNHYPTELKQREIAHQNINPDREKRITLLVEGASLDEAAQRNRELFNQLIQAKDSLPIAVNSVAPFVFSQEEIKVKSQLWTEFWNRRADSFTTTFEDISQDLGYRKGAFAPFLTSLHSPSVPEDGFELANQFESFQKLILQADDTFLMSSIVLDASILPQVRELLARQSGVHVIDGESVAASLVNAVKDDFNFLLVLASGMVFLTMLLIYGRIEITLISFLPMAMSWLWILGLASLFDIHFNFINIMIASIIFGLGDDFAIFITDGLQNKYRYGRKSLATNQAGILLSSITTIIGTGVLYLGQHPAIRSIAPVSVMGISTILLLSFVVQPYLYRALITRRTDQGKPPYTLLELIFSILAFSIFFVGCMICTLLTGVVMLIPFWDQKSKKHFVHRAIQFFTWFLIQFMVFLKKRYYHRDRLDFDKPSIIIANHTSFLDILYLAMQHSKLIFLVGPWVYNSPIFGRFIRFADYIPAFEPIDQSLEKLRSLTNDGYSIVIFPEGHRSEDGKMTRFHKGAFYLSEQLQLDITPVLLHGLSYALPKGDYYVKSGPLNFKVLPRISHEQSGFGEGYSHRAKTITRYFKEEHARFTSEMEDEDYFYHHLRYAYLYKGPVLEWYFRIKYRHEKRNYRLIDQEVGDKKRIVDLGCGNGFLTYFLALRNPTRSILGVDYDEEKIATAAHCYLKNDQVEFIAQDIAETDLDQAEAIILMDVLHYLSPAKQKLVLSRCVSSLRSGGVLLVKDGWADQTPKHQWTLRSERWSTALLKFNKTEGDLNFFDQDFLKNWAEENGMTLRILSQSERSSNALVAIHLPERSIS
jgi:1-acyl-sn-glycerol-3-phosphate acyltransferase